MLKKFYFTRLCLLAPIYIQAIRDIKDEKKDKKKGIQTSTKWFMAFLAWDTFMCHKYKMDKSVLFHHYMIWAMHACMFIPHKDKFVLRQHTPNLLLLESMALITYIQRSGPRKLQSFWRKIQLLNTIFFRIPYWYHLGFNCIIPKLEWSPLIPTITSMALTMISLDFYWVKTMIK